MSDKTGKSKSESSILGSLAKKLKKEDPAKGQGKAGRASARVCEQVQTRVIVRVRVLTVAS